MDLVALPRAEEPSLTVSALAKLMVQPAYAQTSELRDQKYPSSGSGSHRVPFYQSATTSLRQFIASGMDVRELDEAVARLELDLKSADDDEHVSDQRVARLRNNLRVLGDAAAFARLRQAVSTLPSPTRRLSVDGVEVRSTPHLHVLMPEGPKLVFLHLKASDMDEGLARRTLELAHWVEASSGTREVKMSDFEYWLLGQGRVLKWPARRKRTVPRARGSLPILAAAWHAVEPPKSWAGAAVAAT